MEGRTKNKKTQKPKMYFSTVLKQREIRAAQLPLPSPPLPLPCPSHSPVFSFTVPRPLKSDFDILISETGISMKEVNVKRIPFVF